MGSGEDAQFVFAKYDYTAQGNQVSSFFNVSVKQHNKRNGGNGTVPYRHRIFIVPL
jgi:hypothetical protein